ncbi:MAG: Ig-like domain-containing protein [Myxococcota bacterium]|nr:Ig-like domain-containing protein [Myxococcota bacterium]
MQLIQTMMALSLSIMILSGCSEPVVDASHQDTNNTETTQDSTNSTSEETIDTTPTADTSTNTATGDTTPTADTSTNTATGDSTSGAGEENTDDVNLDDFDENESTSNQENPGANCAESCASANCNHNQVCLTLSPKEVEIKEASCAINCVDARCGDGIVWADHEQCDDGNTDETDSCLNNCQTASCGDGHIQDDLEACDEGSLNSNIAPDACRLDCSIARCGDGLVDSNEECDDAGISDTCNALCQDELRVVALDVLPAAVTIAAGETFQLTAHITHFDANQTDLLEGPTWSSNDISIAIVDKFGLVTLTGGVGTATITAQLGNFQASTNVTAFAGLPYTGTLSLESLNCFAINTALPIHAEIFDYFGNHIPTPTLSVVSNHPNSVALNENQEFTITQEGNHQVSVSIAGELHPESDLTSMSANVLIDHSSPIIELTSPHRSEMVESGTYADSTISVQGRAQDLISPITSLILNEDELPVGSTSLTTTINTSNLSPWGISVLHAVATDSCGNIGTLVQSYTRSPSYYAAATTPDPEATIPNGVITQLNQPILDDGDRSDLTDIASFSQAVLKTINLDKSVQTPMNDSVTSKKCSCSWPLQSITTENTGFRVTKTGTMTYDDILIDTLSTQEGQLSLGGTIRNLELPINVHGVLHEGCALVCINRGVVDGDVGGAIKANSISIHADIAVTHENGVPSVSFSAINIQFENLYLDISWGLLEIMGSQLDDLVFNLLNEFETTIEATLSAQLPAKLTPMLQDTFASTQMTSCISTPEPFDFNLHVVSGIQDLHCMDEPGVGGIHTQLYTQVYPSVRGDNISSHAKGAIRQEHVTWSAMDTDGAHEFSVGIKDDLINQTLWAVWYAGGMDIPNVLEAFPMDIPNTDDLGFSATDAMDMGFTVEEMSLSMKAHSPPVLMPSRDGALTQMGVGDMEVAASVTIANIGTIGMSMYLSSVLGMNMALDQKTNQLQARFDDDYQFGIQIESVQIPLVENIPDIAGHLSQIVNQVMKCIIPVILGNAIAEVPLPTLDVGGIAGLPQAEVWAIDNGVIDRTDGGFGLSGSIMSVVSPSDTYTSSSSPTHNQCN